MIFLILFTSCEKDDYLIRGITKDEVIGNLGFENDIPPTDPQYLSLNPSSNELSFNRGITNNERWSFENNPDPLANKFVAIHSHESPNSFISVDEQANPGMAKIVNSAVTPDGLKKNAIWNVVAYDNQSLPVDTREHAMDSSVIKFHQIRLADTKYCLATHRGIAHVEECKKDDTDQMFKVSKFIDPKNPNDQPKNPNDTPPGGGGPNDPKDGLTSNDSNKPKPDPDSKNPLGLPGDKNPDGTPKTPGDFRPGTAAMHEDPLNPSSKPKDDGKRVEGGDSKENINISTEKVPVSFTASSLVHTDKDVVHSVHKCTTTDTVHITSTVSITKTSVVLITSTTTIELTKTVDPKPSCSLTVTPVVVESSVSSTILTTVPVDPSHSDKPPDNKRKIEECLELDDSNIGEDADSSSYQSPFPSKKKRKVAKAPRKRNKFSKALGGLKSKKKKPTSILGEFKNLDNMDDESTECDDIDGLTKKFDTIKNTNLDNMGDEIEVPDFLKNTGDDECKENVKVVRKPKKKRKHSKMMSIENSMDLPIPNLGNYSSQPSAPQTPANAYYPPVQQQPAYYVAAAAQPQTQQAQQAPAANYSLASCNPITVC